MRTMTNEDAAHALAVVRNQHHVDYVVVEGPEDGQWTVMHIYDAIENDCEGIDCVWLACHPIILFSLPHNYQKGQKQNRKST